MATVSKGYTFSASETVTAAKLHSLVDSASVSDIVDADVNAGADIQETKLLKDGSHWVDLSTDQTADGSKYFTTIPTTIDTTAVSAGQIASLSTLRNFCKVFACSGLGSASADYLDGVCDGVTMNVSGEKLAVLNGFASAYDYGTEASASTAFNTGAGYLCMGYISVGSNGSKTVSNLPFSSSSSYYAVCNINSTSTSDLQNVYVSRTSGSQLKFTNPDGTAHAVHWFAIGT